MGRRKKKFSRKKRTLQKRRPVEQDDFNDDEPPLHHYTREELDELHASWFASARRERIVKEKYQRRIKFLFRLSAWLTIFFWLETVSSFFILTGTDNFKGVFWLIFVGGGVFFTILSMVCFCIFKSKYINLTGINDEEIHPYFWYSALYFWR